MQMIVKPQKVNSSTSYTNHFVLGKNFWFAILSSKHREYLKDWRSKINLCNILCFKGRYCRSLIQSLLILTSNLKTQQYLFLQQFHRYEPLEALQPESFPLHWCYKDVHQEHHLLVLSLSKAWNCLVQNRPDNENWNKTIIIMFLTSTSIFSLLSCSLVMSDSKLMKLSGRDLNFKCLPHN